MAAKRFFNESGLDHDRVDRPSEKRFRTRPTFASVIGEVVMVNSMRNFCSALEPMLRRVVNEEVERGLRRCTRPLTRSQSLRIQALEPSTLQLKFSKNLMLPIFTGTKIVDADSSPLQILTVDTRDDEVINLPHPIKVEIVVLDGDFNPGDKNCWTMEEFDNSIVRERSGKRPLLAGEVNLTMRTACTTIGEIELTDNSSWIRSRKFRLGARVVPGSFQGARIKEAMTEAFVVKDHRGELYKKHYPPSLDDEIWRLEKIGKEGAFHKKLASEGVKTVQDFLKMSVVDLRRLKRILGPGMSEKIWEATIRHAKTCEMGNKRYIYRGSNCSLFLNPICQVERAIIDGQTYTTRDLTNTTMMNRSYIETLVRQAYSNWDSLEEVDGGPLSADTVLLTQGEMLDQYPSINNYQLMEKTFQQSGCPAADQAYESDEYMPSNAQIGANDWHITSTFITTPIEQVIQYRITET